MKRYGIYATAAALAAFGLIQAQDPPEPPFDLNHIKIMNPSASATLTRTAATAAPAGAPKLQTWQYQVVSGRDSNTYTGSIVGLNPFNRGARTATIPVVLIPVRVQMTGTVRNFDPTSPDTGCLGVGNTAMSLTQASPLFQPANISLNGVNLGNTQYADAFQRASFWSSVSTVSPAYHLSFTFSVAATQTITLVNGSASAATFTLAGPCSTNALTTDNPPRFGVMDINVVDPLFQGFITNLGITANQFPLFVLYGVAMSDGPANTLNNCCILGYHNGSGVPSNPGQTYGIAGYDAGWVFTGVHDVSVMAHEVMEWVNDPSVNNLVPAWGGLGQVGGCQDNLETGDPLSGTLEPGILMPNGVTYHPQEQAFFNWFLGVPGITAAGGKFSSNGTFGGVAKACPPGGTN